MQPLCLYIGSADGHIYLLPDTKYKGLVAQRNKLRKRLGRVGYRWDEQAYLYKGSIDHFLSAFDAVADCKGILRLDGDSFEKHLRDHIAKLRDDDALPMCSKLYPFQHEGRSFLRSHKTGGLFDDMGLGKTIQALSSIPTKPTPVMIVTTASMKHTWKKELEKWRPDITPVIQNGRNLLLPPPGVAVITNYEALPHWTEDKEVIDLGVYENTVLIADEIHYCKSSKAKRTKNFRSLASTVASKDGRVWGLTGTPLLNNGRELMEVLLSLGCFFHAFENEGAYAEFWPGGWKFPPNEEITKNLAKVSLRREKREVLPDLPSKTYRSVVHELDPALAELCDETLADSQVTDALEFIEKGGADAAQMMGGLALLTRLREAMATAKLPTLLGIVHEFEEANEPLLVFSSHRTPVEVLGRRPGWATIMGGVSAKKRSEIQDLFQAGKLKGIAATIKAGKEGLTLTRSKNVVFVDLDWSPANNAQAEDRIVRIGQTAKGVVITHIVADHAIDERLFDVLSRKRLINDAVLGGLAKDSAKIQRESKNETIKAFEKILELMSEHK